MRDDDKDPVGGLDWEREAIVRVARSRLSFEQDRVDDVLLVLPRGLIFCRKSRLTPLPSLAELRTPKTAFRDRLAQRTLRTLRWRDIREVRCSRRCEVGPCHPSRRAIGRDLAIRPIAGRTIRMFLPYDEADRVLEAARFHLKGAVIEDTTSFAEERLDSGVPILTRLRWPILLAIPPYGVLFSFWLLFRTFVAVVRGWTRIDPGDRRAGIRRRAFWVVVPGLIPGLLFIGGIGLPQPRPMILASLLSGMVLAPYAHWRLRVVVGSYVRRRLRECPPRSTPRPHWFERLCGLFPKCLQNRPVSAILRSVALLLLLLVLSPELDSRSTEWESVSRADSTIGLDSWSTGQGLLILATVFAYLGYRTSAQSASRLRRQDARRPIVFLRSFQDDGCGTFNVTDWRASLMGLQSIHSLGILGPVANYNPIRIVRLLLGIGGDTAEEQLATCLRRHGPFIAIGRPTEGIPTSGAAREYVSDEDWRRRVKSWMSESRLVVLQPGATRGIWWEIERALRSMPRDRLLFSLIAFDRRDAEYESFALRLRATTGIRLPLYRGDAMFLRFDGDKIDRIGVRHRSPFAWPLVGSSTDLTAMLAPALGLPESPRPASNRRPGRWSFDLQVLLAYVAWIAPVVTVSIALGVLSDFTRTRIEDSIWRATGDRVSFGGLEWPVKADLQPISPDRRKSLAFASSSAALGVGGFTFPAPPGDRVDLGEFCDEAATNRFGLGDDPRSGDGSPTSRPPGHNFRGRPRSPFGAAGRAVPEAPVVRREVRAGEIDWVEHRYTTRNESIVIRAGRSDDRVGVHWARFPAGDDRLAAYVNELLDEVRTLRPLRRDQDFVVDRSRVLPAWRASLPEDGSADGGTGWIEVEPRPGSAASLRTISGDGSWDLVVRSEPTALDRAERERAIRELLDARGGFERSFEVRQVPAENRLAPIGDHFEGLEIVGVSQVFDYRFDLEGDDNGRRLVARWIETGGWSFIVLAESDGGDAAMQDLERSMRILRLR